MSKPRLLFVSPFVPLAQGRGTAMRAAANLAALSEIFSVTLLLLNPDAEELRRMTAAGRECEEVVVVRDESLLEKLSARLPWWRLVYLLQMIWPAASPMARLGGAIRRAADIADAGAFDVVHCFRLPCAPLASLARRTTTGPRFALDLDDYESRARFRGLKSRFNAPFIATAQALEGAKFWLAERRHIPQFDKIYVCSRIDHAILSRRFPAAAFAVVPNIVPPPPPGPARPHHPFTFLFVGTLDYSPNKEGILFFCNQVLPLLRTAAAQPFKVRIVGRNPDQAINGFDNGSDVEVIANPPDVAPFYREADACIAPILAGGGTRIKILEAFSFKLPVVSTTIGAEGLEIKPSVNAEIADTAQAFAQSCARLLADRAHCARLAAGGHDLWQANFSPAMLARLFAGLFGALSSASLRARSVISG